MAEVVHFSGYPLVCAQFFSEVSLIPPLHAFLRWKRYCRLWGGPKKSGHDCCLRPLRSYAAAHPPPAQLFSWLLLRTHFLDAFGLVCVAFLIFRMVEGDGQAWLRLCSSVATPWSAHDSGLKYQQYLARFLTLKKVLQAMGCSEERWL